MLRVDIENSPSAVKLLCSGRIVLGLETETLRCIAISRAERSVVIDLRGVRSIDAAGLGLLVELHCRAQERNHALTIANASPRVRRLLVLTRLLPVLQIDYSTANEVGDEKSDEALQAMTA